MANRLAERYKNEIIPQLQKELGVANALEVPKITKISVNAGIGEITENRETLDAFMQEMAEFTGQKPQVRKARKAEAGFKIRKGDVVGLAVTLRRDRMWSFLDKLVNITLPRVRDFRGLSPNSFDKDGNYSIGIREHTIFPEVDPNKTKGNRSLQVTIVTNTRDLSHSRLLLEKVGIPFAGEQDK